MKQVLLADQSHHLSNRLHPRPPITMWMPDDTLPGDTFFWKGHTYTVSQIYGTTLSHSGSECRHTEFPKRHRSPGIAIDQHGGESTGVPGAGGAGQAN